MNLEVKTNKEQINFTDLLVMVSLLWFNSGVFTGGKFGFSAAINMLIFVAAGICILTSDKAFFRKLDKSAFWIGFLFVLTLLPSAVEQGKILPDIWNTAYALMLLIYFCYLKDRPAKVAKMLILLLLLDRMIIGVNTIIRLVQDPNLSRYLALGSDKVQAEGYDIYLVAGFHFVYSTLPILTFLFFKRKEFFSLSLKKQILILAYLIVSVILVIRASFATAILVMIIMFLASFLMLRKGGFLNTIIFIFAVALAYFTLVFALEYMAAVWFEGTVVASRFREVANALQGNTDAAGDLMDRVERIGRSLKTFYAHPLFGTLDATDGLGAGMHSEWVDGLGLYGILRYPIFILFFVKSIQYTMGEVLESHGKLWVYVCIFILGILNPVYSSQLMMSLYIIIPFILKGSKRVDQNMLEETPVLVSNGAKE